MHFQALITGVAKMLVFKIN